MGRLVSVRSMWFATARGEIEFLIVSELALALCTWSYRKDWIPIFAWFTTGNRANSSGVFANVFLWLGVFLKENAGVDHNVFLEENLSPDHNGFGGRKCSRQGRHQRLFWEGNARVLTTTAFWREKTPCSLRMSPEHKGPDHKVFFLTEESPPNYNGFSIVLVSHTA